MNSNILSRDMISMAKRMELSWYQFDAKAGETGFEYLNMYDIVSASMEKDVFPKIIENLVKKVNKSVKNEFL